MYHIKQVRILRHYNNLIISSSDRNIISDYIIKAYWSSLEFLAIDSQYLIHFWDIFGDTINEKGSQFPVSLFCAESEGFEPPDPLRSTVFKTAAFDHSANSPICFPPKGIAKVLKKSYRANFFLRKHYLFSSSLAKNLYWKIRR